MMLARLSFLIGLFVCCIAPAHAQSTQCPTPAVGGSAPIANTPTCASQAFVTSHFPNGATAGHIATYADSSGQLFEDGGPTPVVSCAGLTVVGTGTCPPHFGFDNCSLAASVASNILTVALKDNAGNDPSSTSPCNIWFRNATSAAGSWSQLTIKSALSMTTSATGATLGTANGVPFRIWVEIFNSGGTPVLALFQSVTGGSSPTAIASINEGALASSTAISGSATSAGVFYTPNGTTVSSKALHILGYLEWSSGLTTAGSYASAPTTIQTFGPGIRKPGEEVQRIQSLNTAGYSGTTSTSFQTAFSATIVPTSTANILDVTASSSIRDSTSGNGAIGALFNTTQSKQIGASTTEFSGSVTTAIISPWSAFGLNAPGSVLSQTIAAQIRSLNGGLVYLSPATTGETNLGVIIIKEIMT